MNIPPPSLMSMNVSVGSSGRLVIGSQGSMGSQAPSSQSQLHMLQSQPPPTTVNLPPPGIATLQPSGQLQSQLQQQANQGLQSQGLQGLQTLQNLPQPGGPQPVAPPTSLPTQFQTSLQNQMTSMSGPTPVAAPGSSVSGFSTMTAQVPPVTVLTSVPGPMHPPWSVANSSQAPTSTTIQATSIGE